DRSAAGVFHALVDGPNVAPPPARIAGRLPVVEVARLAANVDHGIDGARAAQHLAARPVSDAVGEFRIRLGAIHPVDGRIEEALSVAHRQRQPETAVLATGLE